MGGIAAVDRLVWQVVTTEPDASARRAVWIVDNASDHHGQKGMDRLQGRWPTLILVHTPAVHGSRLNRVEIHHSIVQRKLLDPNDFPDIATVARALNDVEHHCNEIAMPFDWNFTLGRPRRTPRSPLPTRRRQSLFDAA